MNVLITGGAGFIGSHTCERLVRAGHRVRVVDDLSSGRLANLAAVAGEIEFLELDIRDFKRLRSATAGVEAVIHLAAVASVVRSIEGPLATQAVNATGSLNVLEAARQAGVRRVVLASSASVYGDEPELPKTEASPVRPLSPYAWQKLSAEFYGRFYSEQHGAEFLALRYFNVYGPRQDPDLPYSGVLSIFTARAAAGRPLAIFGDGQQTRDFIHVSDVAEINLRAAVMAGPIPQIVNVATGHPTRIIDAARLIREAAGAGDSGDGILFEEPRTGDIRHSYATGELLIKTLGHRPEFPVADGLRQLVGLALNG